ncbi:PEBP-like protein [Clathrospora elynae]|uniref:PEBP-like protein n=1 Tax=Clathrospora elynae TaxID=706981 RepID=A0A6A5T8J6_9PLEO|nr:PEBP-like protein [Clathrospora elynae]
MSSLQDKMQAFSEHKVIPDVFPNIVNLPYDLTVKWPTATLDTPGKELDREDTQEEPKVFITPPPSESLDNLVLLLTDPDLMMNNDIYFGQVRHWLVTNLSSNTDGSLSHFASAERSPYVGPAPLPNYMYARPHRYVFILARGSGKVEIRPEDLRELQKEYAAAISGKQGEVQDLKDRWGFDAQKLIEKKGLEVLAVNFMRVGGNLKSSVANAVMMGQAAVNKVVGK